MDLKFDFISWAWMLANLVMIAASLYLVFLAIRKFFHTRRREF